MESGVFSWVDGKLLCMRVANANMNLGIFIVIIYGVKPVHASIRSVICNSA